MCSPVFVRRMIANWSMNCTKGVIPTVFTLSSLDDVVDFASLAAVPMDAFLAVALLRSLRFGFLTLRVAYSTSLSLSSLSSFVDE